MGELYSQVPINGYNANPPDDDGSETENNRITWAKVKDKITDPVKTRTDGMDSASATAFGKVDGGVRSTSTNDNIIEADQGKLVSVTASGVTITSPDATDVGSPFVFEIKNNSSGNITLDGFDTQKIDGYDDILIPSGGGLRARTDGSNWFTSGLNFTPPFLRPPLGAFSNLSIKVASNTTITAAAGYVTMSDGTTFVTLPVSGTINMATTGANALDDGSIAQATWYAIWAIAKADGTSAWLASTSGSSPTLPTDYIYKARMGYVRTAPSAAQLMGTWQIGRSVKYVVGLAQTSSFQQFAATAAGNSWVPWPVSGFVPPTASKISFIGVNNTPASTLAIAPNGNFGNPSSVTNPPPFLGGGSTAFVGISGTMDLENTNVYVYGGGGGLYYVLCTGWEDNI